MFKKISIKLVNLFAPEYLKEISDVSQETINRRVAETLSKMNVLDVLLRDYHGTFSQEYERPEDKLDSKGQLGMAMWAYKQDKDPYFEYLMAWIADTHANEMIKRAPVTTERILYGRAQIASTLLIKEEVGRLSRFYEDMLDKNKIQEFDSDKSVDL